MTEVVFSCYVHGFRIPANGITNGLFIDSYSNHLKIDDILLNLKFETTGKFACDGLCPITFLNFKLQFSWVQIYIFCICLNKTVLNASYVTGPTIAKNN